MTTEAESANIKTTSETSTQVIETAQLNDQQDMGDLQKVRDLRKRLSDLTIKLTEVSSEHISYRARTQTEIAELESNLEQQKLKVAESVQTEELQRQLREERYLLAKKEKQIEDLQEQH